MSVFLRRLTAALPGRVRGGLPEVALISMQAAPGARSGARGWRGRGRRRRGAVGRRRVCCRGIFPLWDLPGPVATEQAAVAVMGRRRLPLNASNKWAAGGSRAAGAAAVPAVPRWAAPPPPPGKAPGRTVAGGAGAPRMPRAAPRGELGGLRLGRVRPPRGPSRWSRGGGGSAVAGRPEQDTAPTLEPSQKCHDRWQWAGPGYSVCVVSLELWELRALLSPFWRSTASRISPLKKFGSCLGCVNGNFSFPLGFCLQKLEDFKSIC